MVSIWLADACSVTGGSFVGFMFQNLNVFLKLGVLNVVYTMLWLKPINTQFDRLEGWNRKNIIKQQIKKSAEKKWDGHHPSYFHFKSTTKGLLVNISVNWGWKKLLWF